MPDKKRNNINIRLSTICVLILNFFIISCEEEDISLSGGDKGSPVESEWLISDKYIFDGGVGKDGIRSLENPRFINPSEASYLNSEDLVMLVKEGDNVKAYPHKILDWHEIINDKIGSYSISVNYCPLTGTGLVWNRVIDGKETTFGVSGLLYNSNIIPYDRATDSNWSQMEIICARGELQGFEPDLFHVIETSWSTALEWHPDLKVVSDRTGYARSYGSYPYVNGAGQDYRVFNAVLFPTAKEDCSRHNKERLFGIITGTGAKLYSWSNFERELTVLNVNLDGEKYVVAGNKEKQFITAFKRPIIDGEASDLTVVKDHETAIMRDVRGNYYSPFGEVVEGPDSGHRLEVVKGYMGYWFSWVAVFKNIDVVDFRPLDPFNYCDN